MTVCEKRAGRFVRKNGRVTTPMVVVLLSLSPLWVGCGEDTNEGGQDGLQQDSTAVDVSDNGDVLAPTDIQADQSGQQLDVLADGLADTTRTEPPPQCWTDLPVGEKQIFSTEFPDGTEGIMFGSDGAMYASTGKSGTVWRIGADGVAEPWASVPQAIGLAEHPDGDVIALSLGPSTAKGTPDGAVYRIAAKDQPVLWADGIDSPNFVVALPDGSAWVSDDFDTVIHHVGVDGKITPLVTNIGSPNGMGFSLNRDALFVASTFTPDGEITRIPLDGDGKPKQDGWEILAKFGPVAFPDGLAVDEVGDVYVAINFEGRIVRLKPMVDSPVEDVVTGLQNPASIAFGKAPGFDPCSIYVTELLGKHIWRISVGNRGLSLP